jgi:hypothetical protein
MRAHPHPHRIFLLQFVTYFVIFVDLLHCKYLGIDMYFCASVLWLLVYILLPGAPHEALKTVWDFIEDYYADKPHLKAHKYNNMRLSMFTNPEDPTSSAPELRGKAAEIKALVPALLAAWQHWMSPDDPIHVQIETALMASVKVDELLEQSREEIALSGDVLLQYQHCVALFAVLQNSLAWHFNGLLGIPLFKVTVKTHYFMHSAFQAMYLNPRLSWCFAGEDFMKVVKIIALACASGASLHKAGEKVVQKYCWGLHLQLEDSGRMMA